MKKIVISIFFLLLFLYANSQVDTANNLLTELEITEESQQLLPNKMLFTQRILWGEHGLMRSFNKFELTPEKRQKELQLRRKMLTAHQILGAITLAQMMAQGYVGWKLYEGNYQLKDLHEALATGINITYFSTAALAFFAPPKAVDRKAIGSIKMHKFLAAIHFSSMIAVNVLAEYAEYNPQYRYYHKIAGLTAISSMFLATVVLKF